MADIGGDRRIPGWFDHPALWRSDPAGSGGRQAERVLLDRRTETAAIDRVLGSVRDGFSGTLVLRGGPGVGKTALLGYAIDSASDLQLCGAAGVEAEISLDFGALYSCWSRFCRGSRIWGPRSGTRCGWRSVWRRARRRAGSWSGSPR